MKLRSVECLVVIDLKLGFLWQPNPPRKMQHSIFVLFAIIAGAKKGQNLELVKGKSSKLVGLIPFLITKFVLIYTFDFILVHF